LPRIAAYSEASENLVSIWYRGDTIEMASGYSRERVRLSPEHVRRGLAMVEAGTVPGRGHEYVCDKRTGLVLRVTPTAATYFLKLESKTLRVGSASKLTLDQARDQAAEAKIATKRGKAPRAYLDAFETLVADGMSDEDAWELASVIENTPDRSDEEHMAEGPWRWKDLRKAFFAAKEGSLKKGYFRSYKTYLEYTELNALDNKLISEIVIDDLEGVRDKMLLETKRKPSAVWRSVQQARHMLTWGWTNHTGKCGLRGTFYPWWSRWNVEYKSGKKGRTPTLRDLARTLVVAETHRTLGWTEHATGAGTLAAMWAVVLTAQRTGPLCGTLRERLVPDTERPGWSVAVWTGTEMKGGRSGGRAHALPIPPAAMAKIEAYWKEADDGGEPSRFAFPSMRGDGPVSKGSVNQLLRRLEGIINQAAHARSGGINPETGLHSRKKKSLPARIDLLARYGIEPWTPHDVRRTLASFLDERRLGGAGSAILAHLTDKSDNDADKVEKVTRLHYALGQRLPLKAEGMALWVDAVMEAYQTEKAKVAGLSKAA